MIQKRMNSQQLCRNIKGSVGERQSEGQRFRYLTDLPQMSAVVENPQSLRAMAASEMSLLEKMAADNDKMCNSSLFDENKEKAFDTKMVEEMRFSFSNHDPIDIANKSSHCSDLAAKCRQEYAKAQESLPFSSLPSESLDMRKKKEAIKEEIMNQSIETIKNKYIFNQKKVERPQSIDNRQREFNELDSFSKDSHIKQSQVGASQAIDTVFNKVVIDVRRKIGSNASKDEILPLTRQNLPTIKQKTEEEPILNTKNSLEKLVLEKQSIDAHFIEVLFQVLDRSRMGKIDKYNCNIQEIKEQLQLIFGVIFYRIKFNSEDFTKKQFVQLCLECLRLLPHPPIALFKELDAKWSQKSIKSIEKPLKCENCRSLSRYEEKGVSLYHLLDSPPKEKVNSRSGELQQPSISISKRPYVELRDTRYQNAKIEAKAQPKLEAKRQSTDFAKTDKLIETHLAKEDKYSGKYMKNIQINQPSVSPSKISQEVRYESSKVSRVKPEQAPRSTPNDKQNYSRKYMTNPIGQTLAQSSHQEEVKVELSPSVKKKRNISEQILKEHKKNLDQLQKLNQKMQNYIYHRPAIQGVLPVGKESGPEPAYGNVKN